MTFFFSIYIPNFQESYTFGFLHGSDKKFFLRNILIFIFKLETKINIRKFSKCICRAPGPGFPLYDTAYRFSYKNVTCFLFSSSS